MCWIRNRETSHERPLLEVDGLTVTFPTARGPVDVVKGISFSLGRERLGIVGESGSGKSMTGRSILRLIRKPGKVRARRLQFDGLDLLHQSEKQMRHLRGARISMVMQDPKFSLNPVMTIGDQIAEALVTHKYLLRRDLKSRVLAMLEAVRIHDPERVAQLYPHEVSGGMGQRVMIAMMLIPEPDLLIADEPTSALDVSVQAQVLDIIDDLVTGKGMGLILISHDLNLVARYCDRILVMNSGEIVEECEAGALHEASHPYTRGLLAAMPRMNETRTELPVLDRSSWTTGAGT
ncbi:ABC transporter ATP-binding protein [Labrenzia sp. VG12]|uniref:ABC transporter ATP-binding protein n=1 Tax=Labrenzia sp. VG12 TaxID=2021862 RepID=UPI000B8C3647|nr:ABC transporter ATP-binding protein [Labrenzia sp. VG12]ASP32228.1 peptide ABC transporter ATP-binding protein [Labrenzia sp. VG12]